MGHARGTVRVDLVTVVVEEYDSAIGFFTGALGFELVEDSPSLTHDGRPKRWVVVRPPGAETGILLARADGEDQAGVVGNQVAGRVGFFLRVDDFDAAFARMAAEPAVLRFGEQGQRLMCRPVGLGGPVAKMLRERLT